MFILNCDVTQKELKGTSSRESVNFIVGQWKGWLITGSYVK